MRLPIGFFVALVSILPSCDSGGGSGGGAAAPGGGGMQSQVTLGTQLVQSSFNTPTFLTAPAGDSRLFVAEKGGVISIIETNTTPPTTLPVPFLDISGLISNGGEQGLLGLAFAPDYATSGRFYVSYTDVAEDLLVARYVRSAADANVADPTAERVLLVIPQDDQFHNGGMIAFGPDGYLYVGAGDGNGNFGPDALGNSQNLGVLSGSLLRIDVSGGDYSVPADNPYFGVAGTMEEIWCSGLRNPWRFSFDSATGDLYIGDVGAADAEEINVATAASGGGRGLNYGWVTMEGSDCFMPAANCDTTGLTLPTYEFDHSGGACSVTGGYVYRGASIPALQGQYLFADFCAGWVRGFELTNGSAGAIETWSGLESLGNITSLGEGGDGELYVLTGQGDVLQIVEI
ncbi:MAG: PQQ-dependent sugar dehydrogenase [Planctomycetota bacterium]